MPYVDASESVTLPGKWQRMLSGAAGMIAGRGRAALEPGRLSEGIMGQILTAAQVHNPARRASIAAGMPVESPAWGVNQLCGSGLRTVALG